MIFFFCPDYTPPAGGIRKIYRHADILNAAGIPAAVLHEKRGFRCTWFENDTPVQWLDEAVAKTSDFVALPEIYGQHLPAMFPGLRKVVFNQNCYNTFSNMPLDYAGPCLYETAEAVITVSEDSAAYLRMAFPKARVHRVTYGIDLDAYRYLPEEKERRIAYMPRKNEGDVNQVIQCLKRTGCTWALTPIHDVSEAEAAAALRAATIFLGFGHPEGFGLPPAEAMACGCIVIGCDGLGGREFLRAPHARPVPFGDIRAYVDEVHACIAAPEAARREQGAAAAAFIRERYTPERETESVVAAWRAIIEA